MPIKQIDLSAKIAGFGVGATWEPNDAERHAAWELLLQLGTRTAVAPMPNDEGMIREAFTSLHAMFGITREILTRHGVEVAKDKSGGNPSLATIAAVILNQVLRPTLSRWHPRLADHEAGRKDVGPFEWEGRWEHAAEVRDELVSVRETVRQYIRHLGEAADAVEFADALMARRSP